MSPVEDEDWGAGARFPRVSGDEPESAYTAQLIITFSPRERG